MVYIKEEELNTHYLKFLEENEYEIIPLNQYNFPFLVRSDQNGNYEMFYVRNNNDKRVLIDIKKNNVSIENNYNIIFDEDGNEYYNIWAFKNSQYKNCVQHFLLQK